MLVNKRGIHVEVLNFHFYEVSLVAPVKRLNVALSRSYELLPLELLLHVDIPSLGIHVIAGFGEKRGVMHHLLGDAANIDTGAAQAPLRASRRRLHKISQSYLLAMLDGVSSSTNTARSSSNNEQVEVVGVL